jgi:hypothetical protein
MRTDNASDVTFLAPETSLRRHTLLTPPVRLVCAIRTYFLDMPCIPYMQQKLGRGSIINSFKYDLNFLSQPD